MMVVSMEALPHEGDLSKPGLFIQKEELTEGRENIRDLEMLSGKS